MKRQSSAPSAAAAAPVDVAAVKELEAAMARVSEVLGLPLAYTADEYIDIEDTLLLSKQKKPRRKLIKEIEKFDDRIVMEARTENKEKDQSAAADAKVAEAEKKMQSKSKELEEYSSEDLKRFIDAFQPILKGLWHGEELQCPRVMRTDLTSLKRHVERMQTILSERAQKQQTLKAFFASPVPKPGGKNVVLHGQGQVVEAPAHTGIVISNNPFATPLFRQAASRPSASTSGLATTASLLPTSTPAAPSKDKASSVLLGICDLTNDIRDSTIDKHKAVDLKLAESSASSVDVHAPPTMEQATKRKATTSGARNAASKKSLWKRYIIEGVILGQVYCCGGISVFWGAW